MNHELFFFFLSFFPLHAVNIQDRIEDAHSIGEQLSLSLSRGRMKREGGRERERKNGDACSRGRQGGEIAESARMQIHTAVTAAAFSSILPATCNAQPEPRISGFTCLPLHPCIVLHYALQSSFQLSPTPSPLRPPFLRHTLPSLLLRRLLLPPLASPPVPFSLSLSLPPRPLPSSTRRPVVSQGCTYRFISSCI